AKRPDFTLTLIGKELTSDLIAMGKDPKSGVYVAGLVEDTRPYLQKGTVFVSAIRSGSGTRFKILEAMACGCPVVSTSLGAEGLGAVDGRHILIGDTPRAFADAVLKIMAEPEEAARIGRHARNWVVERHAWSRSAGLVADAYHRLIGSDNMT